MPKLSPWVAPLPKKTFVVGVAEMVASNDAAAELVTYSLGSCLGVAVYDPACRVGGLLHVMLPDSSIDPVKAGVAPFMFVDTGLPRLMQAVCDLGAEPRRLTIKVAGGSHFLDTRGIFNIGRRNHAAFLQLLARNGWTLHAQDIGGLCSRTLRMELATGKICIKRPGINPYSL